MKIFLSYSFASSTQEQHFIARVSYFLKKQAGIETFFYVDEPTKEWRKLVGPRVSRSSHFVLFLGTPLGEVQKEEAWYFMEGCGGDRKNSVVVELPDHAERPDDLFQLHDTVKVSELPEMADDSDAWSLAAEECALGVFSKFKSAKDIWMPDDGIPVDYPFDYEKSIIKEFKEGNGFIRSRTRLEQGCPPKWPKVRRRKFDKWEGIPNPVPPDQIGTYNENNAQILVDVRASSSETKPLTFPEARPGAKVYLPKMRRGQTKLKVGVLVSGGIAPGINAVIHGIVERHSLYQSTQAEGGNRYDLEFCFYRNGFSGLLDGTPASELPSGGSADLGGSLIGTARHDDLLGSSDPHERQKTMKKAVQMLSNNRIDALYLIGGDGTMRAAHALWKVMESGNDRKFTVVGIPKTMDNDILWVWQAFGFLSAVQRAKEAILELHTEVSSNPRLGVIQLFGSDSGFVVSHAVLASGVCDAALIPEVPFSMKGLSEYLVERMNDMETPYGQVVMAETAIPRDVEDYIDDSNYPDLGLNESEKSAILRFVGSSLLSYSESDPDVLDWIGLCAEIRMNPSINDKLSPEVQGVVDRASERLNDDPILQIRLIRALNDLLRSNDFCDESSTQCPEGEATILRLAILLCNGTALSETDAQILVKEPRMAVPHDADRLIRRLYLGENNSEPKPGEYERLGRRLVEACNRNYLEKVFSKKTIKRLGGQRDRRVHGQTPDALRTGGLKVVSRVLEADLRREEVKVSGQSFRVFINEPRHLLRAISPSSSDIIFGHRLGTLAVDNAVAGHTDFMVSQWLTEYVLVPLDLVVLGRKRVPEEGIFWRSVLGNTGQSPRM
jgi:6-phosphofructokinase